MRSVENIAEELFDKIRSRVANIKLGDASRPKPKTQHSQRHR